MNISENMWENEYRKAALLMLRAYDIGLSLDKGTIIDANTNSGNVYLYSEDDNICLFIDLNSDDVLITHDCPYCGEDVETIIPDKCTVDDIESLMEDMHASHLNDSPECKEAEL